MITHDVSLKNYANKVVRMLDGKIHKIEQIDNSIRGGAISNLKDTIKYNYAEANADDKDNLGVREGFFNKIKYNIIFFLRNYQS